MSIYCGSLSGGIARRIWEEVNKAGLSQHPETGQDYGLRSSSPFVFCTPGITVSGEAVEEDPVSGMCSGDCGGRRAQCSCPGVEALPEPGQEGLATKFPHETLGAEDL